MRVTIKKRSLVVAALVTAGIVIVAIGFVVVRIKKNAPLSQTQYYARQLDKLKSDVNSIGTLIHQEEGENITPDQTNKYHDTLVDMLGTCRQMDERYENIKNDLGSKDLKESTEKVSKLCSDLEKVTDYARRQSEATEDFVLFPGTSIDNQSNPSKFQAVLGKTKSNLESLQQDPINDPAVPELIAYIETLQTAVTSSSDNATISKLLNTQQSNFINARRYFWDNTIQIANLQKAIDKLIGTFKN